MYIWKFNTSHVPVYFVRDCHMPQCLSVKLLRWFAKPANPLSQVFTDLLARPTCIVLYSVQVKTPAICYISN